ncbi:MAG: tRNA lysidine(34) synthetase TilS [Dysgonamonadaceae bacterium]|nr:tRNA lysidine(34) synthetase TilS [Dysgonamonadaceae bacterium]
MITGFSGGADSVVLLHILHALEYRCIAAHCNFHLRGEESDRDEEFSRRFATTLGIPFYKTDFDTVSYAEKNNTSIEMAARELRYKWFEMLREKENAGTIAVAHHKDDSIETLLINLVRGTGLKGLTGIKPVNGNIIRPLLCLSKEEILGYAYKNNLEYVTDSSNYEYTFTRNKIRLQVIPLLESINPSLVSGLTQTMENLIETEKIYNHAIKEAVSRCFNETESGIDIPLLLSYPSPEAVLYEILRTYGFGRDVVFNIAKSILHQSGKEFFSDKYRIVKDRKKLILMPINQINLHEKYLIESTTETLQEPVRLEIVHAGYTTDFQFSQEKKYAYFDTEKLNFPLLLRKWQNGDRFMPFGMKGSKKLSDYFSDHKFSLIDKENAWVLCSGNDICWIVGERTDRRFKIDYNTTKISIIKLF